MNAKAERAKSQERVSEQRPDSGEAKEPVTSPSKLQQHFFEGLEVVKRVMNACRGGCERE